MPRQSLGKEKKTWDICRESNLVIS